MTTLILSNAGAALGTLAFGSVGGIFGRALGAAAGTFLDGRLFGRSGERRSEGPRLADLDVQASTDGAPLPQVYGRARITGQIIWATRFEEVATTREERRAGKGRGSSNRSTTTTYEYFANVAIGLCEGPIAHIGRVWADGRPLDLAGLTMRVHRGTETQLPDPLIQAKQGEPNVPAYRGTAYVVFERLALAPYGNRVPQFAFEVVRPIGGLEERVTAVNLIPGATEFGYHDIGVRRIVGLGAVESENQIASATRTDLQTSLDELTRLCPNLERVALVVGWFGDDLRAGSCHIEPAVDTAAKATVGDTWRVNGIERAGAKVVSFVDGRASYGGTPSDASVVAAIGELKRRGIAVTFTPFIFMDIPPGNTFSDPWTGATGQPVHPWRGRITCDPAPGRPGTADASPAAAAQIAAFFGVATASDFQTTGTSVAYAGPPEKSYRRMVLHYAHLCAAAGGVDTFLLGTELRSLTQVRSARGVYPAASELKRLAADVRAIVGSNTTISYAADWTEYGSYRPPDGSGDVDFPLDELWSDANIGVVAIDYYPPITDWRDGDAHADAASAETWADRNHLHTRFAGGEAFDWYYANDAARATQDRLPITDGAYGKPWVFRPKDLRGWWGNVHIVRRGGIEISPTGWVAGMKPIRLAEAGVPAVDKGANQPNLFPDTRSSEGGFPLASSRARDDFVQRRVIETLLEHFDPATPDGIARNPASLLDGRRMLEYRATHLWCWDARPWPAFPGRDDVWGDAANWETGHWLNGRLGAAPLDRLIALLVARFGGPAIDVTEADGIVQGYVVDRPMSGRAAIEPLLALFALDVVENGGRIAVRRRRRPRLTIPADTIAIDGGSDAVSATRSEETDLPRTVTLAVSDAEQDYRRVTATATRTTTSSLRQSRSDLAVVMPVGQVDVAAQMILRRAWARRENVSFALPPAFLALEPADVIQVGAGDRSWTVRVTKITTGDALLIEGQSEDPSLAPPPSRPGRTRATNVPPAPRPFAAVIDVAPVTSAMQAHRSLLAVTSRPWPGAFNLLRRQQGSDAFASLVERGATIGVFVDPLPQGPVWRFDRATLTRVEIEYAALSSVSEARVLDGANAAAVRHSSGAWEILQFARAEMIAERIYRLGTFLRGQGGTEHLAASELPAGSLFVLLDEAPIELPTGLDDIGRPTSWRLQAQGGVPDPALDVVFDAVPGGAGLLPFAPVHARARRLPAGIRIDFVRRSRLDADSWELADVPLGEEAAAFAIAVLRAGVEARVLTTANQTALYTNADEIADFGAPQAVLSLRIRQISASVGAGRPYSATIPVAPAV